jgi:pimeloyl-ACP methyl ester carboxylesterase
MNLLRSRKFWAFAAALWLAVVAVLAVRVYPLEYSSLRARYKLWTQGVRTIDAQGMHGDHQASECAPGGKEDCACVVLLHGLGDSASTWSRLYAGPPGGWKTRTQLLAWDLPGFGRSEKLADPIGYRARLLAKRVLEATRPLCSRATVVGNSFGGWVAAWIALEDPEFAQRLVLIGPAGFKLPEKQTLSEQTSVESLKDFQKRAYHKPRELPDYVWEAAARRAREGASGSVSRAQTEEDVLATRLKALRVPTVVVLGMSDRVIDPAHVRGIAALIPGAILREVPECGHLPQKECPAAVFQAIQEVAALGTF